MKTIILLFTMVSLTLFSIGQSGETQHLSLGVEKVSDSESKIYIFKEGKALRIKTMDDIEISSTNYNIYEEFIVFNLTDTIHYENIQMIRGKVHGDMGRKFLGTFITGYGVVGGFLAIVVMTSFYERSEWLLAAIPFSAITFGGIRMMGARKFKSNRWRVKSMHGNWQDFTDTFPVSYISNSFIVTENYINE